MSVPELDLVFACDCTGSMGTYIEVAKKNITLIIEKIQASEKRDVQFALVGYRDHPPQDHTFITKVFDFTTSIKIAKANVAQMEAQGGGDTPEAVADALFSVLKELSWRPNSIKICVFVADAPPHGLSSRMSSDGFPNGTNVDPIQVAKQMAEKEIIIYSVGCEPQLSSSPFAKEFFEAIAIMTGGRYISLANATALPDIIIGGAEEEIQLEKLSHLMEQEVQVVQNENEGLTEQQVWSKVAENLNRKGVQTSKLQVEDSHLGGSPSSSSSSTSLSMEISKMDTLEQVRKFLNSKSPPTSNIQHSLLPPSSTSSSGSSFTFGSLLRRSSTSSSSPSSTTTTTTSSIPYSFGSSASHLNMEQRAYNVSSAMDEETVTRVMKRKAQKKF